MKDKKEEAPDYEQLYYKAMKENLLLKDKKICLEFTIFEIDFLRNAMFEVLRDLKLDLPYDITDDSDEVEKKIKVPKDKMLELLLDEKQLLIETIIKKLRFEI